MEYEDRVLLKLEKMKPGQKIRIASLQEPDRFVEAVKYLMDLKAIHVGDYSFSPDYTVLFRHRNVINNSINRGIYA